MSSRTRKQLAPTKSNSKTPVKKARGASTPVIAVTDQEIELDSGTKIDRGDLQSDLTKPVIDEHPRKTPRNKASKKASSETSQLNSRTVTTQTVKAEDQEDVTSPAGAAKKGGKRVKADVVAVKEEGETQIEEGIPKKTRKRKAPKLEEEAEEPDGEASPKKAKKKRKTKEEKEAEAMPLAARTTGLRMFIGAHVSGAKGVQNAVTNCVHIGGNAFALFLKSQRKWETPPLQDEHRDGFKSNCTEHKYDATNHILPHGSYLVNLAQEDKDKAKQAYDSFLEDLQRCEALGIKLYNFHPGTTGNASRPSAIARIASALNRAHASTKTVIPLLETMAGSGNVIGSTFADLASIISLINDKSRIGICLDTCHLFAAGYDLRSPSSFASVMKDLDETVGMKYVKALHLNDSKAPFGSRRDLHANIGTGFLGLRAFWNVMNENRFEGLPMVLETPIDRKVEGGDDGTKAKEGAVSEGEDAPEVQEHSKVKAKAKKKGPIKSPKEKTIEDKSIWAREIKLLESLIGMDVEREEFKRLEKELADQGAEERKKHLEAFQRKLAKEQKVKTKDIGSFFVGGTTKGKTNRKKEQAAVDAGSPLSELSELSDSSDDSKE